MKMTTTPTTTPRWWRRLGASVVAMVMASLALLGTGIASAANGNPATIDPAETGTLNIHKRLNPTGDLTEGNGLEQSNVTGTGLDGIEFQIKQIPGIDLTTQAGWNTLQGMTLEQAQTATSGVTAISQTTAGGGEASFADLPLGAYLVHENLTAEQLAQGITPSHDFVVTLPMTHPTSLDQWLYTVHVYPKNARSSITKTVTDASAKVIGDPVNWTILADIPGSGQTDRYVITDTLDSRLTYGSATVSLEGTTVVLAASDYTITPPTSGTPLTITFTDSGLAKLWEAKKTDPAAQVKVEVNTTVNSLGADGLITNGAKFYPSTAVDPGNPNEGIEVEDPLPVTKWGDIEIVKTDEGSGALPGAEFKLYSSEADAKAGTNPLTVGGESTWTTGSDGKVSIKSLRYSDFANNAAVAKGDAGYNEYWLAEVKAPSGYELQANPIEVTVNQLTNSVTVVNPAKNAGFHLPLTGGTGTALFLIIGLAIVTGATVVLVRSHRRAEANA